ncbi:protein kinase [Streptomyces sp. NPDC048567]|uniref:protein kinase domain-containing protein n=1 Tax=Streptomyces sp. NPDC048567 TaxID=3365570 RepID=UPI003719E898
MPVRALRADDPARVADYRLLGRLGEGGMGVVYLARSPRGRMVAVKSIRLELAALPDFRLRFAEEVAIAQRVGGDWTAAVLDADPHAERPWVATAYVPGPTLAEVVARHGPLPERSVRGLASGLCDALADIHAAGLVHRDLKPSNVMITIDGPKVIDFGIVRALDGPTHGGLTSTGVVVGSPGFMAPEQVRGERLTAACDIFSLGSVLAFAAAGRLPFDTAEGRPHALMYRVVHEEPDLTGIPGALLPLIGDCLAKDPEARPSLATLRTREETQFRHLGPWLPAPVLARLGQDAAQLLEHEDPGTVLTGEGGPPPAQPPEDEIGTVPAQHPAVPVTAPVTAPAEPEHRPGTSPRTLAEERNGRNGPAPSTMAVYATLALFGLAALGTTITQLNLLSGTVSDASSLDEEVAYPWGYIQTGAAVGFIVSWLIWCAKTRSIAEEFAPGRLRYEPRLAVFSWFIPLGTLYLPKQIANDVWHASSPTSLGGAMAPATRLHVWWGCAVFTIVTLPLYLYWGAFSWAEHEDFTAHNNGLTYGDNGYKDWDTYDMSGGTMVGLILRILVLPTVVATALYVSRLTAMQQARRTT